MTKRPPGLSLSILDAIHDPLLFAPWFKDRETWQAWFAFLASLFALPMTAEQAAIYRACTGRTALPAAPFGEAWLIVGRRGGKSFMMALIAVFLAVFREWRSYLQPGERATVLVIAADRKQARVILRYVRGLMKGIPMLAALLERETAEAIDLTNGTTIEISAASFRRTRGYAVCAALLDELAFWPSEDAANPDYEVINAIRPAQVQFPGAMLLCASSPYARRGALFDAFRRHHGRDNAPALVWRAATRTMNPTIPQSVIDEAFERDPAVAAAEFNAEFRSDIQNLFALEAIEACIPPGATELRPDREKSYVGFCDPAGGSGGDSMSIGIAHCEGTTRILDLLRERKPPFSPEAVCEEFAEICKRYRITSIFADRYAGAWPQEQFSKFGVNLQYSDRTRSQLYLDLLPLINSRAVDLLDNKRLVSQLVGLERRVTSSRRDIVDHGPGSHDDVANAAAGALVHAPARDFRRAYERLPQYTDDSDWDPYGDPPPTSPTF